MEKYHNDGINVWVNYYFVMKQLRLCLLYRGNRDKHIFHGRTQLLYFRKCVSSGSFFHVREFMYMGGKTDASCRTCTKTQGEYPHRRKNVRFCFCRIAGYGILYHERNAGDRFCGPANGQKSDFERDKIRADQLMRRKISGSYCM